MRSSGKLVCPLKRSHQSIREKPTHPQSIDLVLRLLPAFSETEAGCPVINIKPLLVDLEHEPTIDKIMRHIESNLEA
jgi:hypothetical protein